MQHLYEGAIVVTKPFEAEANLTPIEVVPAIGSEFDNISARLHGAYFKNLSSSKTNK